MVRAGDHGDFNTEGTEHTEKRGRRVSVCCSRKVLAGIDCESGVKPPHSQRVGSRFVLLLEDGRETIS